MDLSGGAVGEGGRPLGCHWQPRGCGVTGAAATVIVALWTWGEGQMGAGGLVETIRKLSGC